MEHFFLMSCTKEEAALCTQRLARFGLALCPRQMEALQAGRAAALRSTGRVELGSGILPQLIDAFCDSPWFTQENLTEELLTLQEIFYHWKNEAGDCVPDDELLTFLRRVYEEKAHGAAEYLAGFTLQELKGEMPDE